MRRLTTAPVQRDAKGKIVLRELKETKFRLELGVGNW
jgi:hypothetical protein